MKKKKEREHGTRIEVEGSRVHGKMEGERTGSHSAAHAIIWISRGSAWNHGEYIPARGKIANRPAVPLKFVFIY